MWAIFSPTKEEVLAVFCRGVFSNQTLGPTRTSQKWYVYGSSNSWITCLTNQLQLFSPLEHVFFYPSIFYPSIFFLIVFVEETRTGPDIQFGHQVAWVNLHTFHSTLTTKDLTFCKPGNIHWGVFCPWIFLSKPIAGSKPKRLLEGGKPA